MNRQLCHMRSSTRNPRTLTVKLTQGSKSVRDQWRLEWKLATPNFHFRSGAVSVCAIRSLLFSVKGIARQSLIKTRHVHITDPSVRTNTRRLNFRLADRRDRKDRTYAWANCESLERRDSMETEIMIRLPLSSKWITLHLSSAAMSHL